MPTNKHATIRYHALDQCFGNPGKQYFIEDLIEACSKAIYDYSGSLEGVSKRQVQYDIIFMESEQGWSIPLERLKEGKRIYYRYENTSFSIRNQPINELEANQLMETLSILNRFKGMPQFEWMEEIQVRLKSAFGLKGGSSSFVSFEQNPYLKGLELFGDLFNAIQYKQVLLVEYKSFRQDKSQLLTIHPYYMKQYNSRWFLFGWNEEYSSIYNLPLDRIHRLEKSPKPYIENTSIDFEEYFEDVIGVTVQLEGAPKIIRLRVNKNRWPYIETKPLHGSQRIKAKNEEYVELELNLQINKELETLLFSFGQDIIIMSPDELRDTIKNNAKQLLINYS